MAYLRPGPRRRLQGMPQPDTCCASCAAGNICESDMLAPPDIMQGPWMGPRLVTDLNSASGQLPQTGGLPPVESPQDSWNHQLQNLEDRWQG